MAMENNKWTEVENEQPSGMTGRKRLKREYESEYDVVWTDGLNKTYEYCGNWYVIELSDRDYHAYWLKQLGLVLLGTALMIVSILIPNAGGFHLYFMFPLVGAGVFQLMTLIETILCPWNPGRMEHMFYDENYRKREKYATLVPPICAAAALACLIAVFVDGYAAQPVYYIPVVLLLAAAAAQYLALKMMRDLPVGQEVNERVKRYML